MLEIKNLSKIYAHNGQQVEAITDLNLSVKDREFIALVGPSGCGKTTLLKIIAGIVLATGGEVVLDGRRVVSPGRERGLVFQQFTLFDWLTVRENITFGLRLQNKSRVEMEKIVNHYLEVTGLVDFADFYPKNLSGGMQQRVAIARTLANGPKILLMDEPFGALDAQTRSQMQEFLVRLWEQEHKTILFVTHDVSEAVFLADKVVVLSPRPLTITKIHSVPFARPRIPALKQSTEFFQFVNQINPALI